MADLIVPPAASPASDGILVSVTPESAGWAHVGFEAATLRARRGGVSLLWWDGATRGRVNAFH